MDSWLKAKAEELAQAAQIHAQHLLPDVDQLLPNADSTRPDGASAEKKLKFGQGVLGFQIECMHVVSVETGTQAARFGVEIGDRLVQVDGRTVPEFDPGDADAQRRAEELVDKWLKEMPLPAFLTFAPPTLSGDASEASLASDGALDGENVDDAIPEVNVSGEQTVADQDDSLGQGWEDDVLDLDALVAETEDAASVAAGPGHAPPQLDEGEPPAEGSLPKVGEVVPEVADGGAAVMPTPAQALSMDEVAPEVAVGEVSRVPAPTQTPLVEPAGASPAAPTLLGEPAAFVPAPVAAADLASVLAPAPAQAQAQAPAQAPAQALAQASAQASAQAPADAPAQAPIQAPSQAPAQAQGQGQTKAQAHAPTQAPAQAPAVAPAQAPAQTSASALGASATPPTSAPAPAQAPAPATGASVPAPALKPASARPGIMDKDSVKNVKFGQGPLGFSVASLHVSSVEKGTQASRLGVEVGDRIVTVDGRPVPELEPNDEAGQLHADELVAKWLREMPLPAVVCFTAPTFPMDSTSSPPVEEVDEGDRGALTTGTAAQLATELRESRRAQAEAVARFAAAKRQLAAQKAKISDLQKQVAAAKEETTQILLNQSRLEAEHFDAREATEERERALKNDVARLQQTLEAGGLAASEAALKRASIAEAQAAELRGEVSKLTNELSAQVAVSAEFEERATAAEQQAESMRRQFGGFREAHEAELELMREEHQLQERVHKGRLEEYERRQAKREEEVALELERGRQEIREAREALETQRTAVESAAVEATAAAVEAAAARQEAAEAKAALAEASAMSPYSAGEVPDEGGESFGAVAGIGAAPPRSPGAIEEVTELHDRIDMLEKRCCLLQRKLNARSPGASTPGFDAELGGMVSRPSWEAALTSVAGPRVSETAVFLYSALDLALRKLTQQLLRRSVWLWVFYAHLLVLYTIAASCYAQSALDPASPVDVLNVQMAQAAAGAGGRLTPSGAVAMQAPPEGAAGVGST